MDKEEYLLLADGTYQRLTRRQAMAIDAAALMEDMHVIARDIRTLMDVSAALLAESCRSHRIRTSRLRVIRRCASSS